MHMNDVIAIGSMLGKKGRCNNCKSEDAQEVTNFAALVNGTFLKPKYAHTFQDLNTRCSSATQRYHVNRVPTSSKRFCILKDPRIALVEGVSQHADFQRTSPFLPGREVRSATQDVDCRLAGVCCVKRGWLPSARRYRSTRAGFPATMASSGTLRVTTLPAPTIARLPTTRLGRMVDPDPIDAPLWIIVCSTFQSASVCGAPLSVVARGKVSFMKVTPCPTKTSSSIITPSQMNV